MTKQTFGADAQVIEETKEEPKVQTVINFNEIPATNKAYVDK